MNRAAGLGIIAVVALAFSLGAEEPQKKELVANGGFEEVVLCLQSSGQHMRNLLDRGFDFGRHPLAAFPRGGWWLQAHLAPAKFLVVEGEPGSVVHTGKRCLYIKCLAENGESRLVGPVGGLARRTYRFSIWARGSGRLMTGCYCYDSFNRGVPAGEPRPARINVPLTEKWKQYSMDVRIEGKKVSRFGIPLVVTGEAWLDDVSLVEVASANRPAR